MNEKCPACRAIEGQNPGGGTFCEDCSKTSGVMDAYHSFQVMQSIKTTTIWYTYVFPLLILGHITLIVTGQLKFSSLFGMLVPIGLWVFNVFWLWPKLKIPRWGKWQKMEDERDKLFIVKLSGKRVE